MAMDVRRLLRYVWALPNTAVGAVLVPCAFAGGGLRVVNGVLEIHGRGIAWILRTCVPIDGGAAAITLGHIVAGCDERMLSATRAHERVHVRQCERWGPAFIPAYLLASLLACLAGADAYEGNVFEREARMVHLE
jgi:hypothetical protein